MMLLERFLSRLVCHPILTEDKHLRVFLTANATVRILCNLDIELILNYFNISLIIKYNYFRSLILTKNVVQDY